MRAVFPLIATLTLSVQAQSGFWTPVDPPRATYRIEAAFELPSAAFSGTVAVSLRNTTPRPIERLAVDWSLGPKQTLSATVGGHPATLLVPPGAQTVAGPLLLELPSPLAPGAVLDLQLTFRHAYGSSLHPHEVMTVNAPTLWWGFGTLNDYSIRLTLPPGFAAATSGVASSTGLWTAHGVRDLVLAVYDTSRYTADHARAGDVLVTVVHTAAGAKCARLVLDAAVDAVNFYRTRFGLYPHASITLLPGMDYPAGGYPMGAAVVAIHGEEQMDKKPVDHFRWITAHEIGHMYFSQYVLAAGPDDLDWLMLGLGLHADREYRRARSIAAPIGELGANYTGGVQDGLDTTLDLTDEQAAAVEFDLNNIVQHGKSTAMMDALESTIGVEAFDRAYRRALADYHGRRLRWVDFERLCEHESGEDLAWFFDTWARSAQYSYYRLVRHDAAKTPGGWRTQVEVVSGGTRLQRVPVAATFEDGSTQTLRTDRLASTSLLTFDSKSPLKDVRLDPGNTLWLAAAVPPLSASELLRRVDSLSMTGSAEEALRLLPRARELHLSHALLWRLGLMLYDGRYYSEALDCFTRAADAASDRDGQFIALAWKGLLLDLLGKRPAAMEAYQAAQASASAKTFRHDQYKLKINQAWIAERLKTPFTRE